MRNSNRRNFLKAAGLATATLPLQAVFGQSSNQRRAATSTNSAPKLTKVTPYVIKTPPAALGRGDLVLRETGNGYRLGGLGRNCSAGGLRWA